MSEQRMDHDVDQFGLIETPNPLPATSPGEAPPLTDDEPPEPTPVATPRAAQSSVIPDDIKELLDSLSVIGNNNTTAGGNIDQSKNEIRIARSEAGGRKARDIQDPEALRRLADLYEAPAGLLVSGPDQARSAFQTLTERRVLLLSAPGSDCGQFSAGLRLGHELQLEHPGLVVREELLDQGLHPGALLVDEEPAAILVDLRGSDHGDLHNVQRALVEFTDQLPYYNSFLVLVLPPGTEEFFEERFPNRLHLLDKPDPFRVLARHTGRSTSDLVGESDAPDQLGDMWPPKIKTVADVMRPSLDRGEQPQRALREALARESSTRPSELRDHIRQRQEADDPDQLALLVAAALLESAASQHIARASDHLLGHSKISTPEPRPPLLRSSPHVRLRELPGEWFNADTGEFRIPGFSTDVLCHFWQEHPDLRDPLLDWLRDVPRRMTDLGRDELEQIADRTLALAQLGGPNIALGLAASWAKTNDSDATRTSTSPKDRYRRSIAVRLLTTAAADTALGKQVRQQLWYWSRDRNADLQLLTSEVCSGMGATFPRIALTRLKHLAHSDNEEVRTSVLAALQRIGTELGASRFLRYMSEWFDNAPASRLAVLAQGVNNVLSGGADDVDPAAAASFWRRAVGTMPPEQLRPLIQGWLRSTAQLPPHQRTDMIEGLVLATDHEAVYIAQVQYASRPERSSLDLSATGDVPEAGVLQQLWTRLDEIDPVWGWE